MILTILSLSGIIMRAGSRGYSSLVVRLLDRQMVMGRGQALDNLLWSATGLSPFLNICMNLPSMGQVSSIC